MVYNASTFNNFGTFYFLKKQFKLFILRRNCLTNYNIDTFFQDLPTVYATGICYKNKEGEIVGRYGTYWGKNDECNSFKPFVSKNVSLVRTQIESVAFALRQAIYDKKLEGVIVKTDSKFVERTANHFLTLWRTNNFHKVDGSPVKNREDIEELDRLLQSIHADVQYVTLEKNKQNILLKYLKDEGLINENLEEIYEKSKKNCSSSYNQKEISNFSNENLLETIPIVFVSGTRMKSGKNNFFVAGYGIHWKNNDLKEICGRFAELPITIYRAQLWAIIVALEQAVNANFKKVEIATDCGMFLTHFKANWLKSNGLPIANYPLYQKILKLTDQIEVKFTYIPESLNNLGMEKAKHLAIDGMAFPVISNGMKLGQVSEELLNIEKKEKF